MNAVSHKKLSPRIGVACVSSPLEVGADKAPQMAKKLADKLRCFGFEVVEIGSVNTSAQAIAAGKKMAEMHVHSVVFGAVSWFEDYLVLDLLEECNVPVLLWSFPGMETGALCGTQQLTVCMKQLGYACKCVYAGIDDLPAAETVRRWVLAAALMKKLRVSKIGGTGHRVAGMTEAAVNEIQLKKSLGPRVVYFELAKIIDMIRSIPSQDASETWLKLVKKSKTCDISQETGIEVIKVYIALKRLINELDLDALAFGCYPDWMGFACIASSLLADEGVPIGCEGDINASVGQLILMLLTGQATHNTDWLEPLEDGTVILTHCGSGSLSLAESPDAIKLSSVRLAGQGVCALFPAKPGVVTLLNVLPCGDSYQVAMLTGEALPTEMVFPGNPLRVRFQKPVVELLDWIHREGLGHHWVAGYGDVSAEIQNLTDIIGHKIRLITA